MDGAPARVLMCAAALLAWGAGEAGQVVIRATARTSALLLVLALSSRSIAARSRRVARASSGRSRCRTALHLVAVLWLGVLTSGDNLRARASLVTLTGASWPTS